MTTHSTSTAIDRRTAGVPNRRALWRIVAAALLFVALAWLALAAAAQGASPLAATDSGDASFAVQPVAASAATHPFTLTVLATNDTWGYLDPCG